ncbi:MAG: hypothetical protein J7463_19160 [Roseiflexus sp.]|jgi:hypothetical protein|nr:hypothetical protein [Roseiflexus sp.]MBO9336944.1 hypothetical protein [Roseiflexus sp.]MBO9366838.1 hypothetical protein [Roseiflexus sp.]MBO9381544.1 hypothetical protein [Roseiflexus sp.]MBO9387671.1 hypothetical protein [Roseiflexus sp.]
MSTVELDALIDRLLPRVLADRDLGDGRVFTRLHLQHLWALSCLYAGQCYDESLLISRLTGRLPRHVALSHDLSAAMVAAQR